MVGTEQRRHSRWYELLLFNFWLQVVIGFLVVAILPTLINWPELIKYRYPIRDVQLYSTGANAVAFFISFLMYKKIQTFPNARSIIYLLPVVAISWAFIFVIILFLRLDYSRTVLSISFVFANCWVVLGYYIGRKYHCLKLAIVPFGNYQGLLEFSQIDSRVLSVPNLNNTRFDALRSDMPDEWQTFLANCALANIPVYHNRIILEQITGRVSITHLSENIFGVLQPSPFYSFIKRFTDICASIILLPLILPILLLVAILIKLESKGSVFYIQERMGYKNKIFKMYKLRSMYIDIEGKDYTDTGRDPRITRVGWVIRKYRIDELPQFLNVLKGEMSLIGPRPESLNLSEWYEKEVPFFKYRHIVRPGISGWAQVTQGYAAEIEGMTEKLQYDFYYIKNFSFWLDILIVLKTIKTMLTGFGAR